MWYIDILIIVGSLPNSSINQSSYFPRKYFITETNHNTKVLLIWNTPELTRNSFTSTNRQQHKHCKHKIANIITTIYYYSKDILGRENIFFSILQMNFCGLFFSLPLSERIELRVLWSVMNPSSILALNVQQYLL